MSQLTKTAKKTYLGLVFANLLIIFALMQLGQYYYENIRPIVPPASIKALTHLVHLLQKKPESNWAAILHHRTIPGTTLTLSKQPTYSNNALLSLQPATIFNLIKQHKKLEFSVFIKEQAWLNIMMQPPLSKQTGMLLSLFLILLAALAFINYWAVKTLNQPIQTLIQSLNYNKDQENWLPIPLTGNEDQKAIFKKINDLQEKVNKLLENRTRVVTAISHDLRTPLTRLKLRSEYLVDSPIYPKIMDDINEMELMIRDTLDYFRDINHEEKPQRFDLVAMLTSLSEDISELGYEVHLESEVNKFVYFGAVNLLKRAFTNLINNAVYYGFSAEIHLRKHRHDIEISIKDKGPGLAPVDLEQVFVPFYRAENSRSRTTGGTGLGLTIAKEIIQMHQGSITLTNHVQGGLIVLIKLPVG